MEPQIQYCRTSDGVSIAYQVAGQGPPFIFTSPITVSHLSLTWQRSRARFDALAEDVTLVRYDGRGSGLSQREPADFSLGARLLDLEAVIERTQSMRIALRGWFTGALTAIAYAAGNPDRLTHLVLESPVANGERYYQETAVGRFMLALREVTVDQWDSVTQAQANRMMEWTGAASLQEMTALLRAAITAEGQLQVRDATRQIDVTPLLKDIRAPTLVLHEEQSTVPLSFSQQVAAGIPNARLIVVQRPPAGTPGWSQLDQATRSFLGVPSNSSAGAATARQSAPESPFRTILFTDITNSSALTQRLGDAKAQEVRRAHNIIVREALAACGGREIKHTGDGIMASFGSASAALDCAVAIQRAVEEGAAPNLGIHIGANAGEPVAEEEDLFGTSVDMARRICDHAAGGEILVSDVVRQLVAGKDFRFADAGEVVLKGFEEPVRVWAVR